MSVVNTNPVALFSKAALAANNKDLTQALERLATGKRINSASDDVAGAAISTKMSSRFRSLDQAVRNANDGISLLQTVDGAVNGMTDALYRMRELAIQSANDTNDQDGRDALQLEFAALQEEISNTITNTTWNGMKVLEAEPGSGTAKFQVGASSADSIALPLTSLNTSDVATAIGAGTLIDSLANAQASLGDIDNAITQINGERSTWGATMNRLTYAADNAANVSMNSAASRSRILDTDYAQATAEMARAMILDQAGTAMLSQANQQPMYVLALLR